MSGFELLSRIECSVVGVCPLYESSTIGPYLLLADYYPILLSMVLYGIGLFHFELYFFFLGLALNIDWLVNWGLRVAIGGGERFPGCGGSGHEMPSYASQHITVLLTMLFLLFMVWHKQRVTAMKLLSLNLLIVVILGARVYIGTNTPVELLIGALVGVGEGVILHLAIFYGAYPYFDTILGWRLCRLFSAENTLCPLYTNAPIMDKKRTLL